MLYTHSHLLPSQDPGKLPIFLQAPWPYTGTATYGGQTAPLYAPPRG
jgi:hypothetical protein